MAFIVQLVQRLREQDPESTPALAWLSEQLSGLGTSPEELVRQEHQRQAAMNVTVRNVITSMRTMATFDWAEFFESVSLVDAALRAGSTSARWTSRRATGTVTRSRTRFEVPGGRKSTSPGRRSLERSRCVVGGSGGHPGWIPSRGSWLLSDLEGRRGFEREIGYRVPLMQWLLRAYVGGAAGLPGNHRRHRGVARGVPLVATHAAGVGPLCWFFSDSSP